jgi:hypothetical protein
MVLRERMLGRRWLAYGVVAWGLACAAAPRLAEAAPLPPARAEAGAADLGEARAALETRLVRERLQALGVSPADAAAVLERLDPAERTELAARLGELQPGGDAAAFLAIGIVIALLVILVLELMGRRIISRPPAS